MERGTTQITKSGIILPVYNPYEELRKVARENVGWELAPLVDKLHGWQDEILARLYPSIHTPQWQGELPKVVIGVENLRNVHTLASYNLVPDSVGLPFRLNINKQHIIDITKPDGSISKEFRYGWWALGEVMIHELGHHKQQLLGKDPFTVQSKITHNIEFTHGLMLPLGIYCNSKGQHYQVADLDKPAGILLSSWGLERPSDVPRAEVPDEFDWFKFVADREGRGRAGTSTNVKYGCRGCEVPIRYGRKDFLRVMHEDCVEAELQVRGRQDLLGAWEEIKKIAPHFELR